jgi:hypothetical protein
MYVTGVNTTELPARTVNKKKKDIMFIRYTEGKVSFLKLGVSGRIIPKYTSKQPKDKQNGDALNQTIICSSSFKFQPIAIVFQDCF